MLLKTNQTNIWKKKYQSFKIKVKNNKDSPNVNFKIGSGTTTQINDIKIELLEKNNCLNADSNSEFQMVPNDREYVSGSSNNIDLLIKNQDLLNNKELSSTDRLDKFLKVRKYLEQNKIEISTPKLK